MIVKEDFIIPTEEELKNGYACILCGITDEKGRLFTGDANCHPDDMEFYSPLAGQKIAYYRAVIKLLRHTRDNEILPELKALKQYLYSINCNKEFNKKAYSTKILYRHINLKEKELEEIRNAIKTTQASLNDYMEGINILTKKIAEKRSLGKTE